MCLEKKKINVGTFWFYSHQQRFTYRQFPVKLVILCIAVILSKMRGSDMQHDLEVTEF
jgi:hypothetical protein